MGAAFVVPERRFSLNDWFIWNGTRCTEHGMHVLELPPPTIPAERMTFTLSLIHI